MYPSGQTRLVGVLAVEFKDDLVIALQVRGRLPGQSIVFPFNLVHQAVLLVFPAVQDSLELPSLNNFVGPVLPFQHSSPGVACLGIIDAVLARQSRRTVVRAEQGCVEDGEIFHPLWELQQARTSIDFFNGERAVPFVVAFLHGSVGLHILCRDPDAVAWCILRCINPVLVGVLLIAGCRLFCKHFKLSNNPIKAVGHYIGLIELAFLGRRQVWWAWGRGLGSQSQVKSIVCKEREYPSGF